MCVIVFAGVSMVTSCRAPELRDQLPDGCVPAEEAFRTTMTHVPEGIPHDGTTILYDLRRRGQNLWVSDGQMWRNTLQLCKPCDYWFSSETPVPVTDMFPLEFLPNATKVRCFGLQLKDGTVRHGAYRRGLSHR